jgi:hypothetical protein
MIPRYDGESQKHYVERALRTHGRIATYDALYNLVYHDGRKCSITRLAAIIWDLRDERWNIVTEGGKGETAVYRLAYAPPIREPQVTVRPLGSLPSPVAVPLDLEPVAAVAEASLPEWARQWRCSDCGGRPVSEPAPMLGDLGRAICAICDTPRYFRRSVA